MPRLWRVRSSKLDQVSGGSPVWPGGHRPYVYGARYLEHMAEVNGEATLGDFARSAAGQWVPYRINAAARNAFGTSVSDSWDAWKTQTVDGYRSLAAALAESAPVTTGETVEGAGRMAMQAMVSPDGETLAFIRSDGVDAAQIRVSSPGGEDARRLTRINGLDGTLSWAPGGSLLFSQLEFTDRYRLTGDLYRAAPDGTVERVTRGRRLTYADAAPDGARAVAVQEGGGTNRLVLVDLATGDVAPLTDSGWGRSLGLPALVARRPAHSGGPLGHAGIHGHRDPRRRGRGDRGSHPRQGRGHHALLDPGRKRRDLVVGPDRDSEPFRRHRPGGGRTPDPPGHECSRRRVAPVGRPPREMDPLRVLPCGRVAHRTDPLLAGGVVHPPAGQ